MKDKKVKKQAKVASALDEQTFGYFKRVGDVINDDDFDDEESRKFFVENVFTQVQNNEMKLFCDQITSRTMEKLAAYLSDIQLRKVLQNIEEYFSKIAMDKFGSHVLQTLICIIPKAIRSERSRVRKNSQEDEDLKSAEELFLGLCGCLKENLPELVNHIYGSHVVRAAFEVLGGVTVSDNVVRSRASRQTRERSSHSEEKKPFIKLSQGVCHNCTFLVRRLLLPRMSRKLRPRTLEKLRPLGVRCKHIVHTDICCNIYWTFMYYTQYP